MLAKVQVQTENRTYPITPDGLSPPSPEREGGIPGEPPRSRFPHRPPETGVGKQSSGVRDLETQQVRLKPVGRRCVLHHAVCDQVAGMNDVLLAGLEGDLVDLALAAKSKKTTASDMSVTPVSKALYPSAKFMSSLKQVPLPC